MLLLVCETPVAPQANAVTIPANALTAQFLAGDTFEYSYNGDLIPADGIINACTDTGAAMAMWSVTVAPTCSKCSNVIIERLFKQYAVFATNSTIHSRIDHETASVVLYASGGNIPL